MALLSLSQDMRRFLKTAGYGSLMVVGAATVLFTIAIRNYQPVSFVRASVANQPATASLAFELSVPKLGIAAPIVPNVDGTNEKEYLKAIEGGVAQLKGSPNPNQSGNLFVFGHSSYYKTKPGDYKEVFRHLDKLRSGDEMTVGFEGQTYRYTVTDSRVVTDTDWSVTSAIGDARTLTLMTCWPPGTLQKRYVVVGTQVEEARS